MAIGALNVGVPKQISASTNVQPRSGALLGIFCSSSSSGTVTIYDDAATGTSAKIVDTFSATAGTWYPIPACFANGCYIVLGGTASITAVVSG